MSYKTEIDEATDTTKQPFFLILFSSVLVFGILECMVLFLPFYLAIYFYITTPLSLLGIISSMWLNYKPNIWTKFFKFSSLSGLLTLSAIRFFGYLLPALSVLFGCLILLSVLIANLLPILDLAKTRMIKEELFSPKTSVGKTIQKFSLAFMSIAGVAGTSFGLFSARFDAKIMAIAIVLGPLNWFCALIMPFSIRSPMSPWEYEKLKTESISKQAN